MRARVVSGILGAALLVAAVLWPGTPWPFYGWPLAVLVLLLTVVGLREYFDACRTAGYRPRDEVGYAGAVLFWLAALPSGGSPWGLRVAAALTAAVALGLVLELPRRDRSPLRSLAPTWLGLLYVGWLFPFAVRLRFGETMVARNLGWSPPLEWIEGVGGGAWLLLLTLAETAAVDSTAYFVGRAFGRRKLAPILSPGKTWEGAIAGFSAAVVVGALGGVVLLGLPRSFAMTAAVLVGIAAQVGDLCKSAIKREAGIKDFGALIPGHGGVLDRFDSLLFAAPTVYLLLECWPALQPLSAWIGGN